MSANVMGNSPTNSSASQLDNAAKLNQQVPLEDSSSLQAAAVIADPSDSTSQDDLAAGSPEAAAAAAAAGATEASAARPSRCPFSVGSQLIPPGPARCPFHAHRVPADFQMKTANVPLALRGRTHQTSDGTARLLADIGGGDRIRELCTRFYALLFEDPVLSQFIFETDGAVAHGQRLADWIIEKMDADQTPWTDSGRLGMRQPSHFRAWNNRARHPAVRGSHFKLDDTRMWMRLHFLAARETKLGPNDHPAFWSWYQRFIGHFIAVYDRQAPAFVAESAEWSAKPQNVKTYLDAGRRFNDVIVPRPGYSEDFDDTYDNDLSRYGY